MKKITFLLFLINSIICLGQETNNNVYEWFDNFIGKENTDLLQGEIYKSNFKVYKGKHPFFYSNEFEKSNLIYKNQKYYNVMVKYNLYEQVLIASIKNREKKIISKLLLFNEDVTQFSIGNHLFERLNSKDNKKNELKGFFETPLVNKHIKLYVRHSKYKKDVPDNGKMYTEFNKNKNEYFLNYKNNFYKIRSKNDLIKLFPTIKKQLINFYRENKILRKKNNYQFIINVCNHINTSINNSL